jgi:hypothetical protein
MTGLCEWHGGGGGGGVGQGEGAVHVSRFHDSGEHLGRVLDAVLVQRGQVSQFVVFDVERVGELCQVGLGKTTTSE